MTELNCGSDAFVRSREIDREIAQLEHGVILGPRALAQLVLCIAYAMVLTLLVLQYSFRHGRLCMFPMLDDVGYFADGLGRLQMLYNRGVPGLFCQYIAVPPHSAYSDFLAAAAFAVFGVHDWAPYAANVVLVLGIFLSANYLLEGASLGRKALWFLFLSTIPYVGLAIHEFRPDHCAAVLTGLAVMVILNGPFARSTMKHKLLGGGLFGLAMLVKPPVFPATVCYFVLVLALALLCDRFAYGHVVRWGQSCRAVLWCVLPFVLIPLPHYLIDGRTILKYIWDVEIGVYSEVWALHLHLRQTLGYYITGPGGAIMLCGHWLILFGLFAVALLATLLRHRRQEIVPALAILLIIFVAYLIPTLNPNKQEFFGLEFDVLLTFGLFRLMKLWSQYEGDSNHFPWTTVLLLIALGWGLWDFHWPTRNGNAGGPTEVSRRQILEDVYCSVRDRSVTPSNDLNAADVISTTSSGRRFTGRPRVLLTGVGDLNPAIFGYMTLKDLGSSEYFSPGDTGDPDVFVRLFDTVDYVVSDEPGSGLVADFLLNYKIQADLLKALRLRPDFLQIGKFTYRPNGKSFYLFQRRDFWGWEPNRGIRPVVAPPSNGWGRVIWYGEGPSTQLTALVSKAGSYDLWWVASSRFPSQMITVQIDGQDIGRFPMASGSTFIDQHIPLTLTSGNHMVGLSYAHWDAATQSPGSVLFRTLAVVSKSS